MSIIELYGIRMQPRYKIFKYEERYYLVDIENGLITFFFPVCSPMFRKRVYSISKEDYLYLKSETLSLKESSKKSSFPFYISVGGATFARLLPDNFGTISSFSNQLFYLFILLAIFSLRMLSYQNSSVVKLLLINPVAKIKLRCKGGAGLKELVKSLVALVCFIGLSMFILVNDEHNLIYHLLNGIALLGYFVFSLNYFTKTIYEMSEF